MATEATGLLRAAPAAGGVEAEAVLGVRARGPSGQLQRRATLTVAADGRDSSLRSAAGLMPEEIGAPIDVLWFSLPQPADPPPSTLGYLSSAGMVLTIDRGTTYQSGLIIAKGQFDQLRQAGLKALRVRLTRAAPVLGHVVDTLTDWDQIKLLSVQMNRLPRWHRPGFIAIGDAAHAMSPMFGVGVNYAIQDAVALANAITPALQRGIAPSATLARVQARRARPVRLMQGIQGRGHRLIVRSTQGRRVLPVSAVSMIRLASPVLRRLAARIIGVGLLPEHVRRETTRGTGPENAPRTSPGASPGGSPGRE